MGEVFDYAKDGVILIAGGGVLWKGLSLLVSKMLNKGDQSQTVTVNAGNTANGNGTSGNGTNGRVYATKEELSKHALTCAAALHEKVNQNYNNLSEQINSNHKESMKTFAEIQVSMARLESMKRG